MWNSICILFGGACRPLCSFWLSVLQEVSMCWGGCKCVVWMSVAMNQITGIGREVAVHCRDQSRKRMTSSQDMSKNIPSKLRKMLTQFVSGMQLISWTSSLPIHCLDSLVFDHLQLLLKKTVGEKGVTPNTIRKRVDRFTCFPLPLRMFCFLCLPRLFETQTAKHTQPHVCVWLCVWVGMGEFQRCF